MLKVLATLIEIAPHSGIYCSPSLPIMTAVQTVEVETALVTAISPLMRINVLNVCIY